VDVEAPVLGQDAIEHCVNIVFQSDVRLHGEGGTSEAGDLIDRRLGASRIGVVIDRDAATLAGELERDSFPNTFACAGYERAAAFQG